MPLHDHFRPPIFPSWQWHSFCSGWACQIAIALNGVLPRYCRAEPCIESALKAESRDRWDGDEGWVPPGSGVSIPFAPFTDNVGIRILHDRDGQELAGCIELASKSNKDRPASRDAFVAKCASHLHVGAGLVIIDAVTAVRSNLHAALLASLRAPEGLAPADELYVGAYRPVRRHEGSALTVWHAPLALGQALPDVPLWLHSGPCVRVELEATYMQTWRGLRMPSDNEA